jgi:hypothetical protein
MNISLTSDDRMKIEQIEQRLITYKLAHRIISDRHSHTVIVSCPSKGLARFMKRHGKLLETLGFAVK